jgi:CRISPR-associated protein Cas2
MDLLVTYDVNTLTKEGRNRLRKVAKVCVSFGQRVQYSVFEITVNAIQRERLMVKLMATIDTTEDSLRIYHLYGGREKTVESYGRDSYIDFTDTLLL